MEELRYVTTENGFVILENSQEEKFKLAVTDALREGTRQLIVSRAERPTSPKQIQTLYRAGKSDEEIANETGEKLEFIQMFTPAVQTELDYVTERVQGTEFVFGNRMMSFADIVQLSFSNASWSSYKTSNSWFVKVTQGAAEALWKYDPRLSLLEPQSDLAKQISLGMQDAQPIDVIIPEAPARSVVAPKLTSQETVVKPSEAPPIETHEESKDAEVFSLLDEIRERRQAASTTEVIEPERELEPEREEVSIKSTAPAKPVSARGRSSLPSWDEIIFGSPNDK